MLEILGLDIGGASLKAADGLGQAVSRPFALWREPEGLCQALRSLMTHFGSSPRQVAVTMTGELCDCFTTKSEGVSFILGALEAALPAGTAVHIWQTDGRFVPSAEARQRAWQSAASNWQALATFAARWSGTGPALLIDVGSTTTDIVPICAGQLVASGQNDPDRLAASELVYLGVERTPLCALLAEFADGERRYPTMAELFATTLDAGLVLGLLPEALDDRMTADGRPSTRAAAHARLARMIGSDVTRFTVAQAAAMAEQAVEAQLQRLAAAVEEVTRASLEGRVDCLIQSGQGEFLVERLRGRCRLLQRANRLSLVERLGAEVSRAACAHAVAALLAERGLAAAPIRS